jgi:hypothetical protein
MMLQILFNHLFGHFADCGTKLPSCPKMLSPVTLFQYGKFFKQFTGSSTFNSPHDFTWCKCRGRRNQDMHMILTHYATQNLDFKRFTGLPDQLANSQCNITTKEFYTGILLPTQNGILF